MKRFTDYESLPARADYIGSTEGADRIAEAVADRLDRAAAPAYIQDADGTRHYFDLDPN